jgi:hypothetical protein
MPALDRPSWEKFAKAVATGKTQRDAYKACGFRAKDVDSAASDLANNPKVKQRIKELTARVTDKAVERAAVTKEWVLEKLRDNAEEALKVKGGSAVANRALELLGKELGLFRDPVDKPPLKLEDLPPETLANMLAEAEAGAAREREQAAAAQGGDAPAPPKVN